MDYFFVFNDGYFFMNITNNDIHYKIYTCNKKITDDELDNINNFIEKSAFDIASRILITHGFDPSDLHISKKFI